MPAANSQKLQFPVKLCVRCRALNSSGRHGSLYHHIVPMACRTRSRSRRWAIGYTSCMMPATGCTPTTQRASTASWHPPLAFPTCRHGRAQLGARRPGSEPTDELLIFPFSPSPSSVALRLGYLVFLTDCAPPEQPLHSCCCVTCPASNQEVRC